MTKDVLQSDIDFARRLIDEKHLDHEIVAALIRRGIEPAAAAQVVQDLRAGRKVRARASFVLEPVPEETPPPTEVEAVREVVPPVSDPVSDVPKITGIQRPERPAGSAIPQHKRKSSPVSWVLVVVVVCLAAATVFVIVTRLHPSKLDSTGSSAADSNRGASDGKAPSEGVMTEQTISPTALVLTIQQDGLRMGGELLTYQNAMKTVSKLIGPPTRTNEDATAGKTIYAYDAHGVLIYSKKDAGNDCIVLDFEALGRTNGTQAPFLGTLKIDESKITTDTDPKTLGAIPKLALKEPGTGSGVIGGRYADLELIFLYLSTTEHLSLLQINLK